MSKHAAGAFQEHVERAVPGGRRSDPAGRSAPAARPASGCSSPAAHRPPHPQLPGTPLAVPSADRCRGSYARPAATHHEIWKCCQSTSKGRARVLQNLIMPLDISCTQCDHLSNSWKSEMPRNQQRTPSQKQSLHKWHLLLEAMCSTCDCAKIKPTAIGIRIDHHSLIAPSITFAPSHALHGTGAPTATQRVPKRLPILAKSNCRRCGLYA